MAVQEVVDGSHPFFGERDHHGVQEIPDHVSEAPQELRQVHGLECLVKRRGEVGVDVDGQLEEGPDRLGELGLDSHELKPSKKLFKVCVERREVGDEPSELPEGGALERLDVCSDVLEQLGQDLQEAVRDLRRAKRQQVFPADDLHDLGEVLVGGRVEAEVGIEQVGVVFFDFDFEVAEVPGELELVTRHARLAAVGAEVGGEGVLEERHQRVEGGAEDAALVAVELPADVGLETEGVEEGVGGRVEVEVLGEGLVQVVQEAEQVLFHGVLEGLEQQGVVREAGQHVDFAFQKIVVFHLFERLEFGQFGEVAGEDAGVEKDLFQDQKGVLLTHRRPRCLGELGQEVALLVFEALEDGQGVEPPEKDALDAVVFGVELVSAPPGSGRRGTARSGDAGRKRSGGRPGPCAVPWPGRRERRRGGRLRGRPAG